LLANYWIGGQELRDFLKPGLRNTDDNMLIEFAAPLRMLSRSSKQQIAFIEQLAKLFHQHSTGLLPNVQVGHLDNQAQANFWAEQSEASAQTAGQRSDSLRRSFAETFANSAGRSSQRRRFGAGGKS
jgi:hypothetical protein